MQAPAASFLFVPWCPAVAEKEHRVISVRDGDRDTHGEHTRRHRQHTYLQPCVYDGTFYEYTQREGGDTGGNKCDETRVTETRVIICEGE